MHPPLEGEGRLAWSAAKCETGWGGEVAERDITTLLHPTPPLPDDAARRRVASTLPLQGRVKNHTLPRSRDTLRPRFANSFALKK